MYDNIKKKVVIAGASKGIGLAIAEKYVDEGYEAILLSRSSPKKKFKKNFFWYKIDLTKERQVENLAKKIINKHNKIDVLVNNIGQSMWKPITEINKKFLDQMFHANLYSIFYLIKNFVPHFKDQKSGNIVNMSSIAGKRGTKYNSVYCATKFGLNAITQSLCKELGEYNIRVNGVCPVLIKTPGLMSAISKKNSPAYKNKNFFKDFIKNNASLGMLPSEKDVADLVFFLSSDHASSITGQSINIDCGVLPQ
jgi:NAD(P)-dependent dehydrogenase (short-subunit alcohol dehydrogenase family)